RQCHLGLSRKRRVATGEDETQPVVLHGSGLLWYVGIIVCQKARSHFAEELAFPGLAAETVDRTLSGGDRDPTARVGRQAVPRPLAQPHAERLRDPRFVD